MGCPGAWAPSCAHGSGWRRAARRWGRSAGRASGAVQWSTPTRPAGGRTGAPATPGRSARRPRAPSCLGDGSGRCWRRRGAMPSRGCWSAPSPSPPPPTTGGPVLLGASGARHPGPAGGPSVRCGGAGLGGGGAGALSAGTPGAGSWRRGWPPCGATNGRGGRWVSRTSRTRRPRRGAGSAQPGPSAGVVRGRGRPAGASGHQRGRAQPAAAGDGSDDQRGNAVSGGNQHHEDAGDAVRHLASAGAHPLPGVPSAPRCPSTLNSYAA